MIKISSLYKVYRSKKLKKCYALNGIDLTLPDAGLVFVLGKSGSGKSTLLNLIGGLDKITSGTIEVDGNDISRLNERKMCNYRNSHVGFIFQDYHLIEELTVYDNILLSLNLRRMKDYGDVSQALARVGLAGYEHRYPSELSGGERQRVAIARAIVKEPRIILADEPTGNLDPQTATSIIALLRNLAQECLVLVVSHNTRDAHNYADRIIELSGGRVVDDYTRKEGAVGGVRPSGNVMIYPEGRELTDEDIAIINANLSRPFVKSKSQFVATRESNEEPTFIEIVKEKLSFFKKMRLSRKFLKRKALAIALSSFMVAVIMVIMSLAQTIINFDSGKIISGEMGKLQQNSLLLHKITNEESVEDYYCIAVGENDIQSFYDAGYKGEIYPVLNYTLCVDTVGFWYGIDRNYRFKKGIYPSEALGTIVVDEAFLTEKFGELKYDAKLEEFQPYGLIITDFMADAILALNSRYKGKTYDDILGKYYIAKYTVERMYVNAIIDTQYEQRYADLFETLKNNTSVKFDDLYQNSNFQQLMKEFYDCLGYSYTTNPNFVEDVLKSPFSELTPHRKLSFNGVDLMPHRTESYILDHFSMDSGYSSKTLLANSWYYTVTPPAIPEGAKYIRVAFIDKIDDVYNVEHEVAKMECALLRFDDNEPIAKEIMNAHKATRTEGVFLDPYDGSVYYTTEKGANGTCVSDYIEIPEGATITEFAAITKQYDAFYVFYDADKKIISSTRATHDRPTEGSIYVNYEVYNEVFGTSYTNTNLNEFVPHKVMLGHYEVDDVNNEYPLFVKEVTIMGLHPSIQTLYAEPDVAELFRKDFLHTYALYFNGAEGIGYVIDATEELQYEPQSFVLEGIHTMTQAVDVFIPIFELIAIILCVGVIFILFNFSSRMIKDKMHEIGILKALGTQNGTIATVFGLQVVLIAIFTCVLATLGYYYFIDLANDVLIESLQRLAPERVVLDLNFLTFQKDIARDNCILVFILAIFALIPSMIKVKVIKPVKIIKTKD